MRSENTGKHGFGSYAAAYTLLFLLMLGAVCSYFALNNLSLVLGGDPVAQHLRALIYYGRWLRELPGHLLRDHALPSFSYSIGLGSDVLTTLHFYVIGDPLNLLSAFVPTSAMAYLYSMLIVVRMYLAGLSFSYLCRVTGRRDRKAVLAGSMMYVFCAYTIFAGWRHPFFLNPMICLPLVLAGAEKVRCEKRHTLMALSVALSAVSNFYFFYMIVIFTVCFAVLQCLNMIGSKSACRTGSASKAAGLKAAGSYLLHLLAASVTGVMMGAFMLLPVLTAFAGNPRSASGYIFSPLYSAGYYLKFAGSMFSFWAPGDFCYMGFPGIALSAFVLLFAVRDRNLRRYRAAFLLCAGGLLLPAAGYALNGFSYVTTRWIWAFVLVASFVLVRMWDELMHMTRRQILVSLGCIVLLFILSRHEVYTGSRIDLYIELGMALVFLAVSAAVPAAGSRKLRSSLAFCLVCAGVGVNCLFGLVTEWGGMGYGYRAYPRVAGSGAEQFNTESAAIRNIEGTDSFYRYSGKDLSGNSSVQDGAPSTQFYWSLANGFVSDFFEEMGLCCSYGNAFAGFDDRTVLNEIAGVKDFYAQEIRHVPYGYRLLTQEENPAADEWPVYRNEYTLPLGITFSEVMSREEYETLDPAAKQQALMTKAVADIPEGIPGPAAEDASAAGTDDSGVPGFPARTVQEYSIGSSKENVLIEGAPEGSAAAGDLTLTALEDKAKVRISFAGTPGSETFLYLKDITYRGENMPERMTFTVKACCGKEKVMTRKLSWFTPREEWYVGRNSFMFPSGYHDEAVTSFVLTLPLAGTYTFSDMKVFTQPLGEAYREQALKLQEETLQNVDLHTSRDTTTWASSRLEGEITVSEPKLLCLQLAYSGGWRAQVDGKAVPVVRTDTMFMGIMLEKGTHTIALFYNTPGLKAGLLITLAGLCILLVVRRKERSLYRRI